MWPPDDAEAVRLLGAWLARWRVQLGVSQRTVAARAGISQGGLSRVERGLQACGSRRLARLICVLDQYSAQGLMGSVPPPPLRPLLDEPRRPVPAGSHEASAAGPPRPPMRRG